MKIRSRLLTKLAAWTAVLLVRLLFRTCRVRLHAEVPGTNPYEDIPGRRYLYCVWHDQIIMTVFTRRPRNMAGLVSRHQDGGYLADALQLVGIRPIRGSTNRGGALAMRQMLDAARDLHVAITPDGPRGPRREAKSGIVFLASHAGRAIIPTAYTCRRSWTIRGNWTDMMFPRPFTTVYVIGGRPLHVPAGASRDELDESLRTLQSEMERLEAAAGRWAATGRLEGAAEPPRAAA